ncbi:ORF14b-e217aa [Fowl aviadenovirus 4]|nr:ORF14b-e217aa [Fowl aviadenovirus 4]
MAINPVSDMVLLTGSRASPPHHRHDYTILCRPALDICDAIHFFDLRFLEFINGRALLPFPSAEHYSHRELNLCLPAFQITIKLDLKRSSTYWILYSHCRCKDPYSLFCRALNQYVAQQWRLDVREHLASVPIRHPISIRAYAKRRTGHCSHCTFHTIYEILTEIVKQTFQGRSIVIFRRQEGRIRLGIPKFFRDYVHLSCFLKTLEILPHSIHVYYY